MTSGVLSCRRKETPDTDNNLNVHLASVSTLTSKIYSVVLVEPVGYFTCLIFKNHSSNQCLLVAIVVCVASSALLLPSFHLLVSENPCNQIPQSPVLITEVTHNTPFCIYFTHFKSIQCHFQISIQHVPILLAC